LLALWNLRPFYSPNNNKSWHLQSVPKHWFSKNTLLPPPDNSCKKISPVWLSLNWRIVGSSQVVRAEFRNILFSITIITVHVQYSWRTHWSVNPQESIRHYARGVWKFDFFVCPVMPVFSFSLMGFKRRWWKKNTPLLYTMLTCVIFLFAS